MWGAVVLLHRGNVQAHTSSQAMAAIRNASLNNAITHCEL